MKSPPRSPKVGTRALLAASEPGHSVIISLPDAPAMTGLPKDVAKYSKHAAGAVFDINDKYRYLLWRRWDASLPHICFVMLNPSTADAFQLDPTIRRCVSFAQDWGYGGLDVVNIFSFRSTQADRLYRVKEPVGRLNDHFLQRSAAQCKRIILAWGNHGSLNERSEHVLDVIGKKQALHHLGLTNTGQPRHPLYVRRDTELQMLIR